jgi:DNA-binding CsgD family transcriptional regulator
MTGSARALKPGRNYGTARIAVEPDDTRARARFVGLFHGRGLTPREVEALWHLLRGVTRNEEIAALMGVTPGLVRNYHLRVTRWARVRYPRAMLPAAIMLAWGAYRWAWGTSARYDGHLHPLTAPRPRNRTA